MTQPGTEHLDDIADAARTPSVHRYRSLTGVVRPIRLAAGAQGPSGR
ncbi:hypothetical protein AB0D59_45390 [Streptomyces sp. NPDC048417]